MSSDFLGEPTTDRISHKRREVLRMGMATALVTGVTVRSTLAQHSEYEQFELEEASVADLQQRLESGQDTSTSLVEKYLARIEMIDRSGPTINSLIEVNPDALAIALRLDGEREAGLIRGPLHGIPIVIKDNIDTADRMMTTAGSLAMVGAKPAVDASVVTALRAAGMVILAKTNMSEWAHFRSWTGAVSGWSGRGGLSKNPYVLDRSTSGSSSGTAAAVPSNLCTIGIGTDTDGSIISPSSCCGLVGIRPTVGLVSQKGIIPISHSLDTAGPMARTVTDAALLLNILASTMDNFAIAGHGRPPHFSDFTSYLDRDGLRSARIGVVRETLFGYSTEADRIAEEALEVLEREGATLIDPANIDTISKLGEPQMEIMQHEFKAGLDAYLANLGRNSPVRSLSEVIAFNRNNKDRAMQYFGQETMVEAATKGPLTSPAYLKALKRCREYSRRLGIDAVITRYNLDALVAPSGEPAWLVDLESGDGTAGWSSTAAAVAGYPHITVPAGQSHGLPVGLSFFGRAWSEPTLIKFAYAFEQATLQRRAPKFLSSLPG